MVVYIAKKADNFGWQSVLQNFQNEKVKVAWLVVERVLNLFVGIQTQRYVIR